MLKLLLFLSGCVTAIFGHGYLLEPVARSSAWLVDSSFRQCCTYSNHMEMFCGGLQSQWHVHAGKCSICGEPYDKQNKLFEKGGAMYKGTIVKTYTQGQQIDVKVVLTANHKGYFEFRLCNLDANPSSDATQECLDSGLLKIANTDSTKFRDVDKYGSEEITVRVQLPSNVACRHCVFQWKYTAGNSWGTDPVTGQSGAGLGKENETFMGCSDISIVANGAPTNPPTVIIPTTTISSSTTTSPWWEQVTTTTSRWWEQMTTTTSSWWVQSTTTTNSWSAQSTTGTTPSTPRPPIGLTSWSRELFKYEIDDEVWYDGIKYRCVAPHTSFPGAEPGVFTWAWWQRID